MPSSAFNSLLHAVKVAIAERLLGCLAAEDTVLKLTPANTPINRVESKLNERWIWILNMQTFQNSVLDYKLNKKFPLRLALTQTTQNR